jgi:hypothetical protein
MNKTHRRLPSALLGGLMALALLISGMPLASTAQASAGMMKAPGKVAKQILADLGNGWVPVRCGRFLLAKSDRNWGHFILKFPPAEGCPSPGDGVSVIHRIDGRWGYVNLSNTGDCPYFKRELLAKGASKSVWRDYVTAGIFGC